MSPHSRVFPDKGSLVQAAIAVAEAIAARSPVAVQGTKENLLYSRDHSVPDSLRYMVRGTGHPCGDGSPLRALASTPGQPQQPQLRAVAIPLPIFVSPGVLSPLSPCLRVSCPHWHPLPKGVLFPRVSCPCPPCRWHPIPVPKGILSPFPRVSHSHPIPKGVPSCFHPICRPPGTWECCRARTWLLQLRQPWTGRTPRVSHSATFRDPMGGPQ